MGRRCQIAIDATHGSGMVGDLPLRLMVLMQGGHARTLAGYVEFVILNCGQPPDGIMANDGNAHCSSVVVAILCFNCLSARLSHCITAPPLTLLVAL